MAALKGKERVLLQEVGPRDGLQSESRILLPEERRNLIDGLVAAGLPRVQIGSFVNPKLVPQMAGTDTLWRSLRTTQSVRYSVLVLNESGLDRALASGIPHVEIYASASETHSRKNANTSVEEAVACASQMTRRALKSGIGVTAGVMCAFGCFYEGRVPVEKVLEMVRVFEENNPTEIGLADTTGMAEPDDIRTMIRSLEGIVARDRVALHLHDTRGFGEANLLAALEMGVRRFDSSIGGLGGCPFIPGAAGNISTERAVAAVESLGFETGVDLERIREVGADLERHLGRSLPG